MDGMIMVQRYIIGPYRFTAFLPRNATPQDGVQWTVHVKGVELPELVSSLEAAMQAAINCHMSRAHDAAAAKSE